VPLSGTAYFPPDPEEPRKMTARPHEKDQDPPAAEPLDPEFVRMIQESLDDPRPDIPAAEVRAYLKALHEERLKRGE
jgi:hypothetical protein